MSIGAIVQARLGSRRLPNKVLLNLNKETILFHVIRRISLIKNLDKIIVAIPKNNKNKILVNEVKKYQRKINLPLKIFEGSEYNVLARTLEAALKNNLKTIIRITSDCPFIDHKVSSKLLKNFETNNYDYARLCEKYGFPVGFETEIFKTTILKSISKKKLSKFDKEHVTPYIWNNEKIFKIFVLRPSKNFKNLRLVVDTPEDYNLAKKIYLILGNNFSYLDIKNLYKKKPDLFLINSMIKQKATIGKYEKK